MIRNATCSICSADSAQLKASSYLTTVSGSQQCKFNNKLALLIEHAEYRQYNMSRYQNQQLDPQSKSQNSQPNLQLKSQPKITALTSQITANFQQLNSHNANTNHSKVSHSKVSHRDSDSPVQHRWINRHVAKILSWCGCNRYKSNA